MSISAYFEMRPVFTGEVATVTATVPGTGTLTGTYAGHLYTPEGTEVAGAVTVAIADPTARTLTVTVAGQSAAQDYTLAVIRTDDSSGLVAVRGVIEVSDPTRQ